MANYWEYNGTTWIKESPLRGLTGLGGGAVMSSMAGETDSPNPWTHDGTYTWTGSNTIGTRIDGGENISWGQNLTEFTFQWEVYINPSATNNSWHLQVTPGWSETGGLLIGIYNTWKVSIAGPQLGGYGAQAPSNLTSATWHTIRYAFDHDGGSSGKNQQLIYYNGSIEQTDNTTGQQTYVTWSTGIWGGAGRQGPTQPFQTAFNGGIRNLKLTDTFNAQF
tara:strand:- start:387 stop:1049 length:663 start_codon:yes stop_codon:yes gene_type:complete